MSKRTPANYVEQQRVHLPLMKVVDMHRHRYPALNGLIHVPNESNRSRAENGILVGMGMRAGVSDLLLLRALRGYSGLAMELKAPGELPKSPLTYDKQWTFLKEQAEANWLCCFADDAAAAWQVIGWYVGAPGCAALQMGLSPHLVFVGVDS